MRKIIFTIALLIMGLINIAQNAAKSPTNAIIPAFPDVEDIKKFDGIHLGDISLFKEIPNIGRSADNPLNNIPGTNAVSLIANQDDLNKSRYLSDSGHSLLNTHSLIAPEGWSGLSSYLIPSNTNIENLFLPYQNQLIILYNQQGVYYPAQQLNTLVNWNAQSGYIAKFNQETSIEFSGQTVQSRVLSLTAGWNLIPVLSECPADVATLFGTSDVVVVKEVARWNLYWPQMGINSLNELMPGKAYYVLMNSPDEITFPNCGTPPWQCGDLLVDTRNDKSYTTVQIGTQCWMAQNLNIGTIITGSINQANNSLIEKYCYNNSEAQCDVYGGIYQWNEAMQYSTQQGLQGICPEGWHFPTDDEFTALSTYLGGTAFAGGKMKTTGTIQAGTGLWNSPNTGATNSSGFSGLPGGYSAPGGSFSNKGYNGYWWSSTQASPTIVWFRDINNGQAILGRTSYPKNYGFSLRCLKN